MNLIYIQILILKYYFEMIIALSMTRIQPKANNKKGSNQLESYSNYLKAVLGLQKKKCFEVFLNCVFWSVLMICALKYSNHRFLSV